MCFRLLFQKDHLPLLTLFLIIESKRISYYFFRNSLYLFSLCLSLCYRTAKNKLSINPTDRKKSSSDSSSGIKRYYHLSLFFDTFFKRISWNMQALYLNLNEMCHIIMRLMGYKCAKYDFLAVCISYIKQFFKVNHCFVSNQQILFLESEAETPVIKTTKTLLKSLLNGNTGVNLSKKVSRDYRLVYVNLT